MSNILAPSKSKIGDLLGGIGASVEIPSYQRNYSWTTDEADDLYMDLDDFSKRHPDDQIYGAEYFLGAIVGVKDNNVLRLIDGQQRLATLTILLSSVRDALQRIQPPLALQLHTSFIQEQPMPGKPVYTNRLTLSAYDRDFFQNFIQTFPRDHTAKPKKASHRLIQRVRNFFDTKIDKALAGKSDDEASLVLFRLWTIVTKCLVVVLVETGSEDDANDVFEVLNERGVGLSTLDLVRNFVLGSASSQERDAIVAAWSEVFSVSESAAKVRSFLRHYWIARHGDVKSRGLYRVIKDQLKPEFKRGTLTPYSFSVDLSTAADAYRSLLEPSTSSEQLNTILTTVSKLEATPLYPAILSTIEKHNEVTACKVAQALTTYYVRWTVIGRRESTELEKQVFSLAKEIYGGLPIQAAISRIRDASPTDQEFEEDFKAASLNKAGQRRPILVALEDYMRKVDDAGEVGPRSALTLHVEHLYPQNPRDGAKLDDHDEWVQRIGNLTLLDSKWNVSIKNGDFQSVKKPEIEKSVLYLNHMVKLESSWGPTQIEARQTQFAGIAPRVWDFPVP